MNVHLSTSEAIRKISKCNASVLLQQGSHERFVESFRFDCDLEGLPLRYGICALPLGMKRWSKRAGRCRVLESFAAVGTVRRRRSIATFISFPPQWHPD